MKNNKKIPPDLEELRELLSFVQNILSVKENNFSYSSWENEEEAMAEINEIIEQIEKGITPEKLKVSPLFIATGPLQEVSLRSGWSHVFLAIAHQFDELEGRIWS